ncbi:MAG TPA: alpha/beta hydrolase [Syntrophorhabdales bacterium]|nr:alpha/beta hydrolase [Syntrophorhabdales bacterium]
MIVERFEVTSGDHMVAGILSLPGDAGRFPCAVLSHGLVSSKESSKYIYLSERFTAAGIAACRFDYHGCGESGGNITQTTLTIRVRDLESVLDHLARHTSVDPDRIGILGSSFGGSTALVEAAKNQKIRCVALWATPYMLENKEDESISDIHFESSIFEDFSTYDLLGEARKISRAIVVHGELDEVVSCAEGKAIYDNVREPKKLIVIKGADHTFTDLAHRDKAAELSLVWFKRYLR